MIFNKRHTSESDSFYYGDDIIEKNEKYKYLGVVYSTKYPKLVKQFYLYTSNLVS